MSERLLKVPEVASRTGLSRSTVYSLLLKGVIPSVALGGTRTRRVREADLDSWIRSEADASAAVLTTAS